MDAATLLAASNTFRNVLRNFPVAEVVEKLSGTGAIAGDILNKLSQRDIILEQDEMSMQIERLAHAHRKECLVLCLGAGISVPYGLPDWNTLLQKLLLTTLDHEDGSDCDADALARLYTAVFSPNPLIAARYLANYYRKRNGEPLAFESAIRNALYADLRKDADAQLLTEVRMLAVATNRNPNLNAIITYNFDDLLERCLRSSGVAFRFQPVFTVGINPDRNELPIYHVHGYLPAEEPLTRSHSIAFSDDQYHEQYQDVYRWSNMVQINKFKENTCLFVGTSFTDPNLRRLLDIARLHRGSNAPAHFLVRKHYDSAMLESQLRKVLGETPASFDEVHIRELDGTVQQLRQIAEKFEEEDARSLGVETLWIDRYEEIPSILTRIRELAQAD
jgi:NAD-dependent SIR2 family protein deacetylase